jgi:hypothetical protein
VFVAIESVSNMDGIVSPLRGMVMVLGLEGCVLVRLYAFNKALEASGGTFLSSGSLQCLRFTITADTFQVHYQ